MSWHGKVEDFNKHFQNNSRCIKKRLTDHYITPVLKGESHFLVDTQTNYEEGSTKAPCKGEEILSLTQEIPVALVEEETRVQGAVRTMVYW